MTERQDAGLQSPGRQSARRGGGPGPLSRWIQRRAAASTVRKVRRKSGRMMGMDVLILHTTGRRSGAHRESPIAWFDDGRGGRVVVASGGGGRNPDWYANLMANPGRAAVELHGSDAERVTPHRLSGPEREAAWRVVAGAAPHIAKYQAKSGREYPLVRLVSVSGSTVR